MPPQVAVVGAGVTGLALARRLARAGFGVQVFERWPDVGGMASAFDLGGGVWLERYYHHLFETDQAMIRLHDELLPGELEWHRSSVAMFAHGGLWPFVGPFDLLRYGPLPPIARVRLGLAVLRLQRRRDWQRMDDVPAIEWLRRECGSRAVEEVWMPLLLGKFGDEAQHVPLAWLWSKLVLRRRLRGGRLAGERLGYPRGSFRRICSAMAADIADHGGVVHLDREVVGVVRAEGGGHRLACAAPGAYRGATLAAPAQPALEAAADVVVLTTPTFVTRALIDAPASLGRALDDWRYRAAVVLLLELDRPFTSTYWINVADPRVRALGLIEHTNLVPRERYPASYLHVANYVAPSDPLASLSTDELLAVHLPGLRIVSPSFAPASVRRAWSFREPAAQPVPRVPNRSRVMPIATDVPGLYVANTTQIYPEDRGTNYSVLLAERAAALVIERHGGR